MLLYWGLILLSMEKKAEPMAVAYKTSFEREDKYLFLLKTVPNIPIDLGKSYDESLSPLLMSLENPG